jgi:nitrite reductase (NADH) small subunit
MNALERLWYDLGPLVQFPLLGARVIERAQGNVAVFRTKDNQVFALLDQCPHKGGPLSQGIVFGESVSCPLHQWTINLTSGIANEPDIGCTARFETKIVNGQVHIYL